VPSCSVVVGVLLTASARTVRRRQVGRWYQLAREQVIEIGTMGVPRGAYLENA